MVKINQKFEFHEILDLESILPKSDSLNLSQNNFMKTDSQDNNQKEKIAVTNRYHLHSILVHRGTVDAGHYFAYIKPSLDD